MRGMRCGGGGKQWWDWYTSLTFALLVVTYALRVFAPGLEHAGMPLYAWVRIPAWASAVVSVALLVRHARDRWRSPEG